jgi:hypothetical protein
VDGKVQLVRNFQVKTPLEVEEESGRFKETPNGDRASLPRLRIPSGSGPREGLLNDVIDSLSFLMAQSLSVRAEGRSRLISESPAEGELLASVGSDEPYSATGARLSIGTASLEVSAGNVEALMDGPRIGVRLYADALRLSLDTSRFRELWKVLESAFNAKGRALTESLAAYEPARQMGFDEVELEHLRNLRGRASHAETSAPDKELRLVENECNKLLPRLLCLAERVILTKKSWGSRSGGVRDRPPPLMSYIDKGGGVVLIKRSQEISKQPS